MTTLEQIDAQLPEGFEPIFNTGRTAYFTSTRVTSHHGGPEGTTHNAFISEHGWEITRLDRWGGTGTRKAVVFSGTPDVDAMLTAVRKLAGTQDPTFVPFNPKGTS